MARTRKKGRAEGAAFADDRSGLRFDHRAGDEPTELHEERLDAVLHELVGCGAASVLDLGCGSGALLRRLVESEQFERLIGVDRSAEALLVAGERLADELRGRVRLEHGSLEDPAQDWVGVDAAVMLETIEHVPPGELSRVERSVFEQIRPSVIVMTTPNRDYNVRLGIPEEALRHPEHQFEWGRAKFRSWAEGVAERNGYDVTFRDIGRADPVLGSPTQMAVFRRKSGGRSAAC